MSGTVNITAGATVKVYVSGGVIKQEAAEMPQPEVDDLTKGFTDVTSTYLENASFESDLTYSKSGSGLGFTDAFVNDVEPVQAGVPNILPVKGWVNGTEMTSTDGNRPYRRMYSMPYSVGKPCVSVEGNYSASCAPYIGDELTGDRCLTVLNSWAEGVNRITQKPTLPAGEYRMLVTVKYDAPNETSNDGKVVTASNGNINTSLIGLKYGNEEHYAYPAERNKWEHLVYDFTLAEQTPVEFSVGYKTSAQAGAANNTLLYVDNVRLLRKGGTGLENIADETGEGKVYSVDGIYLGKTANTASLPKGIYIHKGKKILVK